MMWSIRSNEPPEEGPAGAPDQHGAHALVAVDHRPELGQLAVHRLADRVQVRPVQHHFEDAVVRTVEGQVGEGGIAVGLSVSFRLDDLLLHFPSVRARGGPDAID